MSPGPSVEFQASKVRESTAVSARIVCSRQKSEPRSNRNSISMKIRSTEMAKWKDSLKDLLSKGLHIGLGLSRYQLSEPRIRQ